LISNTSYDIDSVERIQQDIAELHTGIKSKILRKLSANNSGDHNGETFAIDLNFIQPLGLEKAKFNLVAGILDYIDNKGLIKI
jgi:hypothetical protein